MPKDVAYNSPYSQGDWILVPIEDIGLFLGVIARCHNGILLCYFFGPPVSDTVMMEDYDRLRPADALLVERLGDEGIVNGHWKNIGKSKQWDSNSWPVPLFRRIDLIGGRSFVDYYDDRTIMKTVSHRTSMDVSELPASGICGYIAIEIMLSKRFTELAPYGKWRDINDILGISSRVAEYQWPT